MPERDMNWVIASEHTRAKRSAAKNMKRGLVKGKARMPSPDIVPVIPGVC